MDDFVREMDDASSESKEGYPNLSELNCSIIPNVIVESNHTEVSDEDSSNELFESTILEDEELDEDHPPMEAVQGYRPDDTLSSQIYVGVHLRYSTAMEGKWIEGIVVRTEAEGDSKVIYLSLLGDYQPGTIRKITWPNRVFEFYIIEPLSIHKRDGDLKLKNMHVRFTYRNRWRHCGFVELSSARVLRVKSTKLSNLGEVNDYDRSYVSNLI